MKTPRADTCSVPFQLSSHVFFPTPNTALLSFFPFNPVMPTFIFYMLFFFYPAVVFISRSRIYLLYFACVSLWSCVFFLFQSCLLIYHRWCHASSSPYIVSWLIFGPMCGGRKGVFSAFPSSLENSRAIRWHFGGLFTHGWHHWVFLFV